jgi:hypothetical protein
MGTVRSFFDEHSRFFLGLLLLTSAYIKAGYLFYLTDYTTYLLPDLAVDWDRAVTSFYRGDYAPDQWNRLAPFGHIVLAWVFKIFYFFDLYVHKLEGVLALNVLLSTLDVLMVYLIARKLLDSGAYALLAAAVYGFAFPSMVLNAFVVREHPAVFGLLLSLTLLLYRRETLLHLAFAGGILGLTAAIAPIVGSAALPIGIYLLSASKPWRKRLSDAAAFFLGLGTVLTIVVVHLYAASAGKLSTLSPAAAPSFYLTMCQTRSVTAVTDEGNLTLRQAVETSPAVQSHVETTVPFVQQGYYYRQGLDCLIRYPRAIVHSFRNLIDTLRPTLPPDVRRARYATQGLALSWPIREGLLVLMLLIPLLYSDRAVSRSGVTLLAGIVIAQIIGRIAYGAQPHAYVVMGFVPVLLGVLVVWVIVRNIKRLWWRALLYLAAAIAAIYLYRLDDSVSRFTL